MILYARENYGHLPNLRFIQMDASALAFDEPFDMAFSANTLHWVKDHKPMLQALHQCLNPGARILFQMNALDNDFGLAKPGFHVICSDEYKEYFQNFESPLGIYSPAEYTTLLVNNRFRPIRVELLRRHTPLNGNTGLAGLIRTTWMAATHWVPAEKREAFINAIVEEYIKDHPLDERNTTEILASRLEVEAVRR